MVCVVRLVTLSMEPLLSRPDTAMKWLVGWWVGGWVGGKLQFDFCVCACVVCVLYVRVLCVHVLCVV